MERKRGGYWKNAVDTEIIKIKETKLKTEEECEITEKMSGRKRR